MNTNDLRLFAYVINKQGNVLSKTSLNKGWFLVRKRKAFLVHKNPLIIQMDINGISYLTAEEQKIITNILKENDENGKRNDY